LRPRFQTLAGRWSELEPHLKIARPAGKGPWPVVLMFHGCGGATAYLDRYMAAAAGAGAMAVLVDSFAHRRIGRKQAIATVCTGAQLQGWRRAGDVMASVWGVGAIEGAAPTEVVLAGWSRGGWSIMDLMTMPLARAGEAGLADPDPALLSRVRGLFLAYPYCGPGALTQLRAWRRCPEEVFAFVGEADRVTPPPVCRRALRARRRPPRDLVHPGRHPRLRGGRRGYRQGDRDLPLRSGPRRRG
jgi:dienelactone hydrolase